MVLPMQRPPTQRLPVTPIPTDLAEEIRDFLLDAIESGGSGVKVNTARELRARVERCLDAEPLVARAWLLACLAAFEVQPVPVPVRAPNLWLATEFRPLAEAIQAQTGRMPALEDGILKFWMRTRADGVTLREIDTREKREGLLVSLREAARWVRLDHEGGPIE